MTDEAVYIPTLKATPLFERIREAQTRYVVLQGTTRSSKTFGILQHLMIRSFEHERRRISVVRAELPTIRKSCLIDWRSILMDAGAVDYFDERKTELTFTNNQSGSYVEFQSFDSEQKARGPQRDDLFLNEGNEIDFDVFVQLRNRTSGQIYIDYNPSMLNSWIYDEILTDPDCTFIESSYKDNPFLTEAQVKDIERSVPVYLESGTEIIDWTCTYSGPGHLIRGDVYTWTVYGLGRRGSPKEAIYPPPYGVSQGLDVCSRTLLGLDFGYEHAMVLVRVGERDAREVDGHLRRKELHIDELFHGVHTLLETLIEQLPALGVGRQEEIICDAARPDDIARLRRAGYNAREASKGPGSVWSGIQAVKAYDLYFTPRSKRSQQQFENYRRQTVAGVLQEEPIKKDDDAPDAVRYPVFSRWYVPPNQARVVTTTHYR